MYSIENVESFMGDKNEKSLVEANMLLDWTKTLPYKACSGCFGYTPHWSGLFFFSPHFFRFCFQHAFDCWDLSLYCY